MIPGKTYTPELVLQLAWRRKWLIAIPAFLIAVSASLFVYYLEDVYVSSATILVIPQRVPESLVRSTVTTSLDERLTSMRTQIMSRTRLERIVQEFNLYQEERKTEIMEDIVERMRDKDIIIQPSGESFLVGFRSSSARTAQRVAEKLAGEFIDESLRDRGLQAENTNQFLESQVEASRQRLLEEERKQEEYRRKYEGELPEQLTANQQGVQNVEMQLAQLTDSLNRARDRHRELELQLNETSIAQITAPRVQAGAGTFAAQLTQAQEDLKAAQERFQPNHPDLVTKRTRVEELQKKADAEAAQASADGPANPAEIMRRARLDALKQQIADLDRQIEVGQQNERRLRAMQGAYQSRIEATPTRKSELAELSREYPTIQATFSSLASKKEDAQIAANLERRQIGEQFRLVDPARVPAKPASPDRPRYYLLSVLGGLAVGLGLAGLMEYLDRTMRSEDDVRAALSLPVLAAIPLVLDTAGLRRRTRMMAVSASVALTMLVSAAFVVWKLLR